MKNYTEHEDYQAFLEKIKANPADNTVRLVLCDWLDELRQDDAAARAEFIRVQIELANHPCGRLSPDSRHALFPTCQGCDRVAELRKRERELFQVACYPPDLVGSVVPSLDGRIGRNSPHVVFRRGFVAEVKCTLAEWTGGLIGIGSQLVRSQPVEKVVLTDREPWHNDRGSNPIFGEWTENRLADVWAWLRFDGSTPSEDRFRIHGPVWKLLQPNSQRATVEFDSLKEAKEAISDKLIAWAKNPTA